LSIITPRTTDLLLNGGPNIKARKINTPKYVPIISDLPDSDKAHVVESDVKPDPKPQKPLKIAMIGTAPSSRMLAPYSDPDWTIWGSSPGNMDIPRADAWFEIHSNLLFPECAAYGVPYVEWLKKQTFPIYMQDQRYVPNAIALPLQELVAEFGKFFFTSTFAYMIAMGIKAGAKEIALFGIDMASKDEYILQRPGGHYFMQKAAERGITVSVPYESDLAQAPELYGYGSSTPFGRKIQVRKQELESRIAAMKAERDRLHHVISHMEGALEDLCYINDIWGGLQT
jgi:hypothetical protein